MPSSNIDSAIDPKTSESHPNTDYFTRSCWRASVGRVHRGGEGRGRSHTDEAIDGFRNRSGSAEISTLDIAIRERDTILARIGDCQDEAEARKHLGDLTRAEETVIIKQARLPPQQAELATLIDETLEGYNAANEEWRKIIEATPTQSAQAFRDLLHAAQLDPEIQKVEKANPVVVDAIRPLALASQQDDLRQEAWRAANITSDVASKRVEGFQSAIKWLDKVQSAHAVVAAEDKRMTATCEAFRKVLAKG